VILNLTRRSVMAALGAALIGAYPRKSSAAGLAAHALMAALIQIEARSGGRLGVAIHDTATGLDFGHRLDERFPLCSTFKVLACAAVLARVDAGQEDLNRRIRFTASDVVTYSPVTKDHIEGEGMTLAEICAAGMTQSDNTAANLILDSLGGPAAVTAFARSLGDGMTRLDRVEPDLNEAIPGDPRDTTTPQAMTDNLRALVLGRHLSRRSRDQLVAWMVSNQTGGAKLRAGVPPTWRVGDKTGGGNGGTTNDVAVIWPPHRKPLIVSVYLTETQASFDDRNAVIADVGQALAELLKG